MPGYAYQARQNYLRQQHSIKRRLEALMVEAGRERAEKQAALQREEVALAAPNRQDTLADYASGDLNLPRLRAALAQ